MQGNILSPNVEGLAFCKSQLYECAKTVYGEREKTASAKKNYNVENNRPRIIIIIVIYILKKYYIDVTA